jgi:S-DNA-T family DNA segregation ATPase FtsK/SpoIIIE
MDARVFTAPTADLWTVTWQHGPDAGGQHVVGPGRYVVGRAHTAEIRCDDPAIDRHEGMLEIGHDGSIAYRSFGAGRPATVDPEAVNLGASTLAIRRGRPGADARAAVVDRDLIRRPRVVPRFEPAEVPASPPAPTRADRPGGLLPATLGLAGAASMALLLHQPMFLVFGAVGASVAIGSWLTQWLAARRRHRHLATEHVRALARRNAVLDANRTGFVAWHRDRVPTLAGSLAAGATPTASLWSRRIGHPDAFIVDLGDGPTFDLDGAPLGDLPVDATLGDGDRLAILGVDAHAVTRSIITQLTASCGPADLRIIIVTERPTSWEMFAPLPHVVLPDGNPAIVDEGGLAGAVELLGARAQMHLLVVTDCARPLATRTSPLRRLLGTTGVALLAAFDHDHGVPHLCTAVLRTEVGRGWWTRDTSSADPAKPVRIVGLGATAAATHARSLATLHDPEDSIAGDTRLPRHAAFLDLIEPFSGNPAEEIARRWLTTTHRSPRTPIGSAPDGLVDIDLVRDGPHGLLAGTTGSGKSELLRTLVAGLALHTPPDRLAIVLVDYKGGATFDALVRLPHVVGVITDLDDHLADRALRSLHAELRRREAILREHGVADVAVLHERLPDVRLPRLLVVIDEFAALVAEQPDFLHALVGVAQRGRSLGVHLLLATQRPHGVISDDIRANTDLRIALRLLDSSDAIDVVGDRAPVTLPRTVPGRGVLRLGTDEHVTFQTGHLPQRHIAAVVDWVVAAAAVAGATTPGAPWLPPLPRRLRPLDLPNEAVGLCDDPDHQTHRPLHWSPCDGDVLVVGSAAMGRSSSLRLLISRTLTEPDTHVFVLHADASCSALPEEDHHRALRVHVAERERVTRLLHRLRHAASGATGARTVLVVDDLDEVRRALDDPDRSDDYDGLDAVFADPGVRLIVAASRPSAVPATVIARCAHRWVLHLHDPHDAGTLGVPAACNPPAVPGRIYAVPERLEAQLALPPRRTPHRAAQGGPEAASIEPIDPIPSLIASASLVPARSTERRDDLGGARHGSDGGDAGEVGGDADVVALGVDCTTGHTAFLEIPDGEHVLVLGPARSGRSTTLTRVVVAWRTAHPDGTVLAVLPRRSAVDRQQVDHVVQVTELGGQPSLLSPHASGRRDILLVVDDAELVDDPEGLLATLAASRRPGVTIVAAARPDAIRQTYGHWTGIVRRSRLGVVATGGGDTDGDVLGVVLPRHSPLRPRVGLAWLVDHGQATLVQVAVDTPGSVDGLRAAN